MWKIWPSRPAFQASDLEQSLWARRFSPTRQQIFVSPSGAGGGASRTSPTTLAKALQACRGGDEILLSAGVHEGDFRVGARPDAGEAQPIRIAADPLAATKPVIEGGLKLSPDTWLSDLVIQNTSITVANDLKAVDGAARCLVVNCDLINNRHRHGGATGEGAAFVQCIFWNNGYERPSLTPPKRQYGVYDQGDNASALRTYRGCLLADQSMLTAAGGSSYNLHLFSQAESSVRGFRVADCHIFNRLADNLNYGEEVMGSNSGGWEYGNVMSNCLLYRTTPKIGSGSPASWTIQDCYMARGQWGVSWQYLPSEGAVGEPADYSPPVFARNTVISPPAGYFHADLGVFNGTDWNSDIDPRTQWDNNQYLGGGFRGQLRAGGEGPYLGGLTLEGWREETKAVGLELDSNSAEGAEPSELYVKVTLEDFPGQWRARAIVTAIDWGSDGVSTADLVAADARLADRDWSVRRYDAPQGEVGVMRQAQAAWSLSPRSECDAWVLEELR